MADTMGSLAAILAIQNQQQAEQRAAQAAKDAQNQIQSGQERSLELFRQGQLASQDRLLSGMENSLSALNRFYDTGRNDITSGRDNAINAIQSGGNTAQRFYDNALGQSQNYLTQGVNDARSYLNTGYNDARSALNQGVDVNRPYYDTGISANTMYSNALGLNGADGNNAATAAFQTSPGYQFALDQATKAAANKASSLGVAGSGNTLDALTRLGIGYANQDYGNWLGRLSGVSAQGQSAAGNMQSGLTNIANLADSSGRANAQLSSDYGANMSNLSTNYGTNSANLANTNAGNIAGVYSNAGNSLGSLATGQGSNIAGVYTGANNNLANNIVNSTNNQANTITNATNNVASLTNQLGQNALRGSELFGNYITGAAATQDAAKNAAQNRNNALFAGGLSALGSLGGYALAGPMGGMIGSKLFGTAANAVTGR